MLPAPTTPYMCACLIVYIKYFYVSKPGNTTNYEWSRIKKNKGIRSENYTKLLH